MVLKYTRRIKWDRPVGLRQNDLQAQAFLPVSGGSTFLGLVERAFKPAMPAFMRAFLQHRHSCLCSGYSSVSELTKQLSNALSSSVSVSSIGSRSKPIRSAACEITSRG